MDVAVVRRIAEELGYQEVLYGAKDGIIIFESSEDNPIQVHIWYTASTVAVNLPHPRREKWRSFFFNVSTSELTEILQFPWKNDTMQYKGAVWLERPTAELESEDLALSRHIAAIHEEISALHDEASALQNRLSAIPPSERQSPASSLSPDASIEELERRKLQLAKEISLLEKKKSLKVSSSMDSQGFRNEHVRHSRDGASSPPAAGVGSASASHYDFASQKSVALNRSVSAVHRETPGRLKGNRCLYSFSNEAYQTEFARAWAERPVSTVALARGYIIVYEDGGVAWWNIPFALEQKFRDADVKLPPLKLAALGAEENYFVKFVNGKMEWVAKDSFQRAVTQGIEDRGLYVNHVAMGANGSWAIIWSDNHVDFEGIPADLATLVQDSNENGPPIREISLGPSHEWFAIFTDNSVQANNVPNSLHQSLMEIKQDGGRVRSIVFGENSSWYMRYWDGKP